LRLAFITGVEARLVGFFIGISRSLLRPAEITGVRRLD
jgi:hypothetical protein